LVARAEVFGEELRMPMTLETSWGRVRVTRCHQA
jgi:hypothetical protein